MSADRDPILVSAERLCETLERIGDALVALDADTLLDTEATLDQILASLRVAKTVDDRKALEALIRRAAHALKRCRILGGSFTQIAGVRLRMRTGVETYGRGGAFAEPAVAGTAVRVTT